MPQQQRLLLWWLLVLGTPSCAHTSQAEPQKGWSIEQIEATYAAQTTHQYVCSRTRSNPVIPEDVVASAAPKEEPLKGPQQQVLPLVASRSGQKQLGLSISKSNLDEQNGGGCGRPATTPGGPSDEVCGIMGQEEVTCGAHCCGRPAGARGR